MTRLALALLLAITAVVALPAAADGRQLFTVGIGEQDEAFFADPRVEALGLRQARLIADYDLAASGHYDAWMKAAWVGGFDVLVAFNHHSRRPRRLPSVAGYKRMLRRFLRRYPWVRTLSAWNEANASYQPTGRRPRRAAQYYSAARSVCPDCTVVAADVLDRRGVYTWLRAFKRYVRGRPRLWGIHNYVDANRGRRRPGRSSTERLTRRLPGRVWVTETGGVVAFRRHANKRFSYHYNERRASRATGRVFRLARASRRITRVYIYHWQAPAAFKSWDSGLVDYDGRARPALDAVRREINRQRGLLFLDPVPELPVWLPAWDPVASHPNVVPTEPATSPAPPSGGITRGGR